MSSTIAMFIMQTCRETRFQSEDVNTALNLFEKGLAEQISLIQLIKSQDL